MRKNYCHFNGKIVPVDKIKINPYDLGFLRGHGVFDVMCTANSKPFLLDEHWKRLRNSAKELGLKIPVSKKEFKKILKRLVFLNRFKKATIRTVLTGGISTNGFSYCRNETFIIFIEKFKNLPNEIFEKGAKVVTHDHERHIPTAKSCNYVEAIRHQHKKTKSKSLEIIYTKNGKALEASTSNFFIVKRGKIITPKDNILLGITRYLVIKIARQAGYVVQERDVKIKELYSADEVFLTATNKDIVPIIKVDDRKIAKGTAGEITKNLIKFFKDFTKKY